ncbi:oxidoreductase [Sphingobium sp. LB126]|uniref:SDR family NAD(P)-dependent oxidoreductase n=1 Tax=Sphingobium sp. LB126 TaxID=1983755 RepID=UPI000C2018C8|nr:glucose 1-dehydrogenase [Sphingobium sp. LB126]PJG47395.1 oxidoreductase [Sphingobium sp. LB126]
MTDSGILKGKIAVITGGSSGIGRAIAQRYTAEGADVIIVDRDPATLSKALSELGSQAGAMRADVASKSDLDRLFDDIRARWGRIDILVANAGGGAIRSLGEIDEAHYDSIFATNVKGTLFTVQAALPLMPDGSAIILTGSDVAIQGNAGLSVYAASKAAIRSFARNWILDLKERRIRVNTLCPGPVNTPGLLGLVPPDQQAAFLQGLAAKIPAGRVGEPSEIANAALFLASDAASFVNGIELFVDGGNGQV